MKTGITEFKKRNQKIYLEHIAGGPTQILKKSSKC